jgi:ElaB/YqjD/DUF883 family membrane-anchored ribosome-binding protein
MASLRSIDAEQVYDQLDNIRDYLSSLSRTWTKLGRRQLQRARQLTVDSAADAEGIMKENLLASIILALGIGVAIGYFIGRETQ